MVCSRNCGALIWSRISLKRGVGGWGNILPAWSWQGVLPEEPARNMNLSSQALHTVTNVFLSRAGFMAVAPQSQAAIYSAWPCSELPGSAADGAESVGPRSAS